jgi:long-chain fatty acid transport protein
MKRLIFILLLPSLCFVTISAFASGYRIPEQSLNSTALSSAYVANANGADAAYYNPANMSWSREGWTVEGGFSYIHLPSIDYEDNRGSSFDGDTKEENFIIPTFFAVSPDYNNFRFGFALVFPAGLAKRWDETYPKTFVEENSMTVIEANPSLSYKFNDKLSIGVGARLLYSDATVKSDGTIIAVPAGGMGEGIPPSDEFVTISRDLDGDTTEFGYNIALTFKPIDKLTLAATYRSEVDLDMDGDGTLKASDTFPLGLIPGGMYDGSGSVSIPVPDVLSLAVAYTFEKATVEFEYDRTFWSSYDELDIDYSSDLGHPILTQAFDDPIPKDWDDVDAFRIGLSYLWSQQLTLMVGGGIDGNPVPDKTLSFDLPDSDAWFGSCGFRYNYNDRLTYGAAYLYADKEDRSATNDTIDGEFSGASSHLLNFSLEYLF